MVAGAKKLVKRPLYWLDRQLYLSGIRSLGKLALPHFLVIGAGQSGTTWLQDVLASHPEVFLPQRKETHYFDRGMNIWPLGYYASMFSGATGKVRGEICPPYNILRKDRIRFIQQVIPDVRLILIARNPIDRAWSEARRSLGKVAKQQGVSLDSIDDSEFYRYFEAEWTYVPEYGGDYEPGLRQGYYSRSIDNWLAYFPSEQLQVRFFDEIVSDPKVFLRLVCEHIGISQDIDWAPDKLESVVNKNPEFPMPDRFRRFLERRYGEEIEELYRRFGASVDGWRCLV